MRANRLGEDIEPSMFLFFLQLNAALQHKGLHARDGTAMLIPSLTEQGGLISFAIGVLLGLRGTHFAGIVISFESRRPMVDDPSQWMQICNDELTNNSPKYRCTRVVDTSTIPVSRSCEKVRSLRLMGV